LDVVKIESITIQQYCRRLAAPLTLAQGVISERKGVIIRVVAENGLTGLGEAAPLIGFSPDSIETATKTLSGLDRTMHGKEIPDSIVRIGDMVRQAIPAGNPATVFGMETALCDLAAQKADKSLSSWLASEPLVNIPVNYLMTGEADNWIRVASEIKRGGYKTVKIKVGGGEPTRDVAIVRQAVDVLGNDIALRLDANRRWSFDSALQILNDLRECNIEYVEEPLSMGNFPALARLKAETGVRIALDETLAEAGDIESLMAGGLVDVVIVKPTVLGGIRRTLELAEKAHRHGRPVVITSMFESEIGLAALVHLAAAVCVEGTACGLNTMSVFAESHASELLRVEDGAIRVPTGPGLGLPAGLWEAV
jgi:o-succinylbenzoate synthase